MGSVSNNTYTNRHGQLVDLVNAEGIGELPDELLTQIFSETTIKDLNNLSLVNKHCRDITFDVVKFKFNAGFEKLITLLKEKLCTIYIDGSSGRKTKVTTDFDYEFDKNEVKNCKNFGELGIKFSDLKYGLFKKMKNIKPIMDMSKIWPEIEKECLKETELTNLVKAVFKLFELSKKLEPFNNQIVVSEEDKFLAESAKAFATYNRVNKVVTYLYKIKNKSFRLDTLEGILRDLTKGNKVDRALSLVNFFSGKTKDYGLGSISNTLTYLHHFDQAETIAMSITKKSEAQNTVLDNLVSELIKQNDLARAEQVTASIPSENQRYLCYGDLSKAWRKKGNLQKAAEMLVETAKDELDTTDKFKKIVHELSLQGDYDKAIDLATQYVEARRGVPSFDATLDDSPCTLDLDRHILFTDIMFGMMTRGIERKDEGLIDQAIEFAKKQMKPRLSDYCSFAIFTRLIQCKFIDKAFALFSLLSQEYPKIHFFYALAKKMTLIERVIEREFIEDDTLERCEPKITVEAIISHIEISYAESFSPKFLEQILKALRLANSIQTDLEKNGALLLIAMRVAREGHKDLALKILDTLSYQGMQEVGKQFLSLATSETSTKRKREEDEDVYETDSEEPSAKRAKTETTSSMEVDVSTASNVSLVPPNDTNLFMDDDLIAFITYLSQS